MIGYRPDRQWIVDTGFYAVRLTKNGPEVGCEVTHAPSIDPDTGTPNDRPWLWVVNINGFIAYCAPRQPPQECWIGRRVTEQEYRFLVDRHEWAKAHDSLSPEANPRQAFSLAERPIPFL